jgi:serine/threonine protein kinase
VNRLKQKSSFAKIERELSELDEGDLEDSSSELLDANSFDENQIESPLDEDSSMMLEDSEDLVSKQSMSEVEDLDVLTMCDEDALIEFAKKDKLFKSIDLMIQMEYCSGRSLSNWLDDKHRKVDREKNFSFFRQILSAVKHIH